MSMIPLRQSALALKRPPTSAVSNTREKPWPVADGRKALLAISEDGLKSTKSRGYCGALGRTASTLHSFTSRLLAPATTAL
eukprot:1185808-Prorocentrum_minimum.AAC.1